MVAPVVVVGGAVGGEELVEGVAGGQVELLVGVGEELGGGVGVDDDVGAAGGLGVAVETPGEVEPDDVEQRVVVALGFGAGPFGAVGRVGVSWRSSAVWSRSASSFEPQISVEAIRPDRRRRTDRRDRSGGSCSSTASIQSSRNPTNSSSVARRRAASTIASTHMANAASRFFSAWANNRTRSTWISPPSNAAATSGCRAYRLAVFTNDCASGRVISKRWVSHGIGPVAPSSAHAPAASHSATARTRSASRRSVAPNTSSTRSDRARLDHP